MKAASFFIAGLAVAILSIAPANAEYKCSFSGGFVISPVQCMKPVVATYVECTTMVREKGGGPVDSWWWCTSQGFKK
jgi:hypothetical protein